MKRLYTLALSGLAASVLLNPSAARAACSNPIPAQAVDQTIDSTVQSDFDPYVATPPNPTTKIAFTVLVPEHCAGDTFPVVFNYAAWGTRRIKSIASGSRLPVDAPAVLSNLDFLKVLPNYGYVVISADPRGIGDSVPAKGGGPQRLMDPKAEIQDARQILDWAYDHAADYAIQTESGTGIPKDLKLGTYGVSYGGGFQMPLAALDKRIDAMVPVATWYDIYYSIVPGGAIKSAWGGALCLIGPVTGQVYTPFLGALCDTIGATNPQSGNIRTETDLSEYFGVEPGETPTAAELRRQQKLGEKYGYTPGAFPTKQQVVDFLVQPGMGYFEQQQKNGQPWGFGESSAKLRAVPSLFIQGNGDLLFNLTEGYSNWRYFKNAGGDVRLMSINGGHNALAAPQTGYCGTRNQLTAAMGWFDHYLKGKDSEAYTSIDPVCISVSNTQGAPYSSNVGVALASFPVGSLSGTGAVPARLATATVSVKSSSVDPEFVSVATISGRGKVLAGVPTVGSISVKSTQRVSDASDAVALVGVGIKRGRKLILVDQQIAGFAEGSHTSNNPHIDVDGKVLLPAVGEMLQDGDEVGLLFYRSSYDYNALLSGQTPTSVLQFLEQIAGLPIATRVLNRAANANGLLHINPYEATVSDIQLPILDPGTYPGSKLLR